MYTITFLQGLKEKQSWNWCWFRNFLYSIDKIGHINVSVVFFNFCLKFFFKTFLMIMRLIPSNLTFSNKHLNVNKTKNIINENDGTLLYCVSTYENCFEK